MSQERRRAWLLAALVAAVASLPFLRGLLRGGSFYFRDLSLQFFPLRRFALEGLARGELRLWNPLVHEGIPLSLPALGYPVDLVQLLSPHEPFLSLVLALHVPLGALAFLALARGLGLSAVAAAGGALGYALGGFLLASLNLYILVQAAAWAPLVVLGLVRVLSGAGARALAGTALALAMALSTTGVELAGQAVFVGLVLGLRHGRALGRRALAALVALGLATALAAPVLVLVSAQIPGSARAQGFPTEVVLSHSVHPFALVQVVVGGLFGDLNDLANDWWGDNFFPRGFPYIVSLYLGAALVSLAIVGLASGAALSRRLLLVAGLGLVASLGRFAGLAPLVDALPWVHAFRFPVKAFFSVHLACAMLAGLGLQALAEGRRLRTFTLVAGALGALLSAMPLVPRVAARECAAFAAAFLPPRIAPGQRLALLGRVLDDAAAGGLVALGAAGLAALAARGLLAPRRAAWLLAALATADLLRAGGGLNPMVSSRFYQPSPELAARLATLREGRVFACWVESSRAYAAAREARPRDHETLTFAAMLETLTPDFNLAFGVPTAMSIDRTMLAPIDRVLTPEEAACRDIAGILPRLREAGVTHVLSLDALEHAELEPLPAYAPARLAPLTVHAYRLRDPLARFALSGPGQAACVSEQAGRIACSVAAAAPATLVVRQARAPGWSVTVDGEPRRWLEHGRHLSVALAAGRRRVVMRYAPRRLGPALLASALAGVVIAGLAARRVSARPLHGPAA